MKRSRSFFSVFAILLILNILSSCSKSPYIKRSYLIKTATPKGIYHTIEKGQTLWRICKAYEVEMQEVAEINDITDPSQIWVGQRIFIPGAKKVLKIKPFNGEWRPEPKIVKSKGRFFWPVKGKVTSRYGIRKGRKHDGIDIAAPVGTIVLAGDSGKVIYRGRLRGYGKILILRHRENYVTVYAHLKEWLVRKDRRVKRGEAIARVGITGKTSGGHLHFEIRFRDRTRNPLFYLK